MIWYAIILALYSICIRTLDFSLAAKAAFASSKRQELCRGSRIQRLGKRDGQEETIKTPRLKLHCLPKVMKIPKTAREYRKYKSCFSYLLNIFIVLQQFGGAWSLAVSVPSMTGIVKCRISFDHFVERTWQLFLYFL